MILNVLTRLPVESIDRIDDDDIDDGDWYTIKTDVDQCSECGVTHGYVHTPTGEYIVVWPDDTDKMIIKCAKRAQELGMNPRIVPYEKSMGKCISFYKLPR